MWYSSARCFNKLLACPGSARRGQHGKIRGKNLVVLVRYMIENPGVSPGLLVKSNDLLSDVRNDDAIAVVLSAFKGFGVSVTELRSMSLGRGCKSENRMTGCVKKF